MLIVTIRSLSLVLLSTGLVTQAAAQGTPPETISLFRPAPIAPPSALASNPGAALGMRPESVGVISYRALSIDAASAFRGRSRAPRSVEIALPGGRSLACAFNSDISTDGLVVMSGTPAGGGVGNRCELIVDNGRVTGTIDIAGGRYVIRPLEAANAHAVVEVKTEAFPNEMTVPMTAAEDRPGPRQTAPMCDVAPAQGEQPKSFGPIRVLVAYTAAAKGPSQSMAADIQSMIQQFRDAMSTRLTGGYFSVSTELAHAVEVNYRETDSPGMDNDLRRLSDPQDSIFKTIHALRDTHKADLVHLVIKGRGQEGCGIGWMPNKINLVNDKAAFSVSDRQCATQNYSFAHELGHNIGMNHDRAVVEEHKPGPEEFNFGYVLLEHGVRTTMAYNDACKAAGKNCRRLLVYSNPRMNWTNPATGARNVPFGRATNGRDAAYNAEVLCRNADAVSKLR